MLDFTEKARQMVVSFAEYMDSPVLRIALSDGSPLAAEFEFTLVEAEDEAGDDVVVDMDAFQVRIEPAALPRIDGAAIDYVSGPAGSGFQVTTAEAAPPAGNGAPASGPIAERVRRVLEERVNPAIAAHGGNITMVGVEDDVVYVEMHGGCQGCGMARVTLRQGVERMIREAVPEVSEIRDITDHASGTNPFYSPA